MSIKYRPEIDGLRALAVIPVILFHAGFPLFSGGFVGVDVFFVISGYLITSIIFTEIQDGKFSILYFYERRARRIIPALATVCFCCIPFALLWLFPQELKNFGQSLAAVALFSSNILFWLEAGYFDTAAELKPLLHTWTLAVEEQFYVFFPLLLLALRRLSIRTVTISLVVLGLASLALAQVLSATNESFNFFMLITRGWELMVGAVVAIVLPGGMVVRKKKLNEAAALAGLGLILWSVFIFDETVPFPSVWTLMPVLGTALLVIFCSPETIVGRLLTTRLAVVTGLISYSAYLWHQPIFAFARIRSLDAPSTQLLLVLSLLSLLLAYVTYKFIEQPFRNKRSFSRRYIFIATGIVSAMMIGVGVILQLNGGFPSRINTQATAMMEYANDFSPYFPECHSTETKMIDPKNSCVYGDATSASVAIWGDSHATTVSHRLGAELQTHDLYLRELTYEGCLPVLGYYNYGDPDRCSEYNEKAFAYLKSHGEVNTVVLHGRYTEKTTGKTFDNQEGGVEPPRHVYAIPVDKGKSFINSPQREPALAELYIETVQQLIAAGKRVVLVYPVPEAGWHIPTRLAKEIQYGVAREKPLTTSYEVFVQRTASTHRLLDKIPDDENLLRVYPENILCNTTVEGRCITERDGIPLYADDNHLSTPGAQDLAELIIERMQKKGWTSTH